MAGLADTYKQMISEKKVDMEDWEGSKPDKDLDAASGEKEGTEADEKEDKEAVDCLNKIEKKHKKKDVKEDVESLEELTGKGKAWAIYKHYDENGKTENDKKKSIRAYALAHGNINQSKKIRKELTKEESEQLDEISKSTLKNYIDKSSSDVEGLKKKIFTNKFTPKGVKKKDYDDNVRKYENRTKGMSKAFNKVYESVDLLSLIIDKKPMEFVEAFHEAMLDVIQTPVDLWRDDIAQNLFQNVNEDEQIDELSKGTLRSYIGKASDDLAGKKKAVFTNKFTPKGVKKKDYESNVRKFNNRASGISKAFSKVEESEA